MPLQNALAFVGVAKQVGKGTPLIVPAYAHGVKGGKIIEAAVEQAVLAASAASRQQIHAWRSGVTPQVAFTSFAHKASLGLYLLAAWGAITTTGTVTYTHIGSVGDTLPWLTFIGKRFNNEIIRAFDVKVAEFGLSWDGPNPLELSVAGPGCGILPTVAAFGSITTDETNLESFFVPVGGSFKIKGSGSTTAAAVITGGEVKVNSNPEVVFASSALLPSAIVEKKAAFEVSLKVVPDDLALWREILTATGTGTTVAPVQYGAFEMNFVENLAGAATLKLESARTAFACELPDVDPDGGPVELTLSGIPLHDGTNAPVKPTLVNTVVSY